jgi:hypothetical protein
MADLKLYFGVQLKDVVDFPVSELSPREVLAYIRNLPPESATVAELRGGPEFLGWGNDRYMMADLIDAIRELIYVQVASKSKKKPQPPKPYERPDTRVKTKKSNNFAAMARAAFRMNKKAG